jgi:hypothetical protein
MVRFKKLIGFVEGEMMVCGSVEACRYENRKRKDGAKKNADGVPVGRALPVSVRWVYAKS